MKEFLKKHPYINRVKGAMLIALAPCFTFLFFGQFELIATNADSISFTVSQMTVPLLIEMIVVFVIMSLILGIFKNKIYRIILAAVSAFTIAGYIQGNFLNGQMAELTGIKTDWESLSSEIVINSIIWLVIVAVVMVVLLKIKEELSTKINNYGSILLIVMQLSALISLVIGGAFNVESLTFYLTKENMFNYSKESNTIVYVLDRFDYRLVERLMEEEPEFFDELDGFTNYTNTTSEYPVTYPSINYMLTGAPDACLIPKGEYLENSWEYRENNLITDLYDDDVSVNLYSDASNLFYEYKEKQQVDNIMVSDNMELKYNNVMREMLQLSLYRYAPMLLKSEFETGTHEINADAYKIPYGEIYTIDETEYDVGIEDFSLVDNKMFHFFHFWGPHDPFTLNEDGTRSEGETSEMEQTKGSLRIVFRALDKLRELGVYEDANIIITADHSFDMYEPPEYAARIMMFYKPSGSSKVALKTSSAPISQRNIPPTIMKAVGLPYEEYGIPIDEVSEDSDVIRYHHKIYMDDRTKLMDQYRIEGDASNLDNWNYIDTFNVIE